LIETAKACALEPSAYIQHVLDRVAATDAYSSDFIIERAGLSAETR
jgi:hypothetical protein